MSTAQPIHAEIEGGSTARGFRIFRNLFTLAISITAKKEEPHARGMRGKEGKIGIDTWKANARSDDRLSAT